MISWQMTGLTDRGMVRTENEDSIVTRPEMGLAILADGMGGHQAGEVASGMAVEVVSRHFENVVAKQMAGNGGDDDSAVETKAVADAIRLANTAIYEVAQSRPDYSGMGSTIVVVRFFDDKICVGHVGDSRLYRYRAGNLRQLTEDHSVVQELLKRGLMTAEEARLTIGKNLVTRALGVDAVVIPDVAEDRIQDGDLLLLCSDGLNDVISDDEIRELLRNCGANLDTTAKKMVDLANARGGPDNVSVILARGVERG